MSYDDLKDQSINNIILIFRESKEEKGGAENVGSNLTKDFLSLTSG